MFEEYRRRAEMMGGSIRESLKKQSAEISESLFSNSTSVRDVIVNGKHLEAKITTDSKTTVRGGAGNYLIEFRHGYSPKAGTYVQIPDSDGNYDYWLILYESEDLSFRKHIIKRCNYLLRWKNAGGEIIERWSVFSDNTRLQDGEWYTANNKMMLPRFTMTLLLPCDSETINIKPDKRFIIDNALVDGNPDTWIVSNRNIVSKTYSDYDGVIELAVNRHQFNHVTDSKEFMIANYYNDYEPEIDIDEDEYLSCEIVYNGTSDLKMGTPFKVYSVVFYANGIKTESVDAVWDVTIPEIINDKCTYEIENKKLKIKCKYDSSYIGSHIRLKVEDVNKLCSTELPIKVVSSI